MSKRQLRLGRLVILLFEFWNPQKTVNNESLVSILSYIWHFYSSREKSRQNEDQSMFGNRIQKDIFKKKILLKIEQDYSKIYLLDGFYCPHSGFSKVPSSQIFLKSLELFIHTLWRTVLNLGLLSWQMSV